MPLSIVWFFLSVILIIGPTATARPFIDEDTQQLLVEAIEAAAFVDLFHERCRSDRSGRRTENLNKLITSKFRITIVGVQDDLFPERSFRRARERLQEEFGEMLREAGGCREARASGMAEALGERYRELFSAVEALP